MPALVVVLVFGYIDRTETFSLEAALVEQSPGSPPSDCDTYMCLRGWRQKVQGIERGDGFQAAPLSCVCSSLD